MAVYVEEEEVWKCPKHPSKRRRNGICPTCLRDRLGSLCPDCHHPRPCSCAASAASSASSSSSSSSSAEPSFRRSRSVAVTFLRFRNTDKTPTKTPSFLSAFKQSKTKRSDPVKESAAPAAAAAAAGNDENFDSYNRIEDFAQMVTRSRSVSVGTASAMASGVYRRADVAASPARGKFWNFPSPMKAFRSSKTPKIVAQDRSPLPRG